MATPDFAAIRAGLATNLAACTEAVRVHDFYPDAVDGPAVVVDVPSIISQETPTTWVVHVDIILFVSKTWDRASEAQLNRLVGPLIDAIESDCTADGSVNSLFLIRPFAGQRNLEVGGNDYVGGTFTVEAIVS